MEHDDTVEKFRCRSSNLLKGDEIVVMIGISFGCIRLVLPHIAVAGVGLTSSSGDAVADVEVVNHDFNESTVKPLGGMLS